MAVPVFCSAAVIRNCMQRRSAKTNPCWRLSAGRSRAACPIWQSAEDSCICMRKCRICRIIGIPWRVCCQASPTGRRSLAGLATLPCRQKKESHSCSYRERRSAVMSSTTLTAPIREATTTQKSRSPGGAGTAYTARRRARWGIRLYYWSNPKFAARFLDEAGKYLLIQGLLRTHTMHPMA